MDELENGIVKEETKEIFLRITNQMIEEEQLDGLILGCTELPMILGVDDFEIALLNTTDIHVSKMIDATFFRLRNIRS